MSIKMSLSFYSEKEKDLVKREIQKNISGKIINKFWHNRFINESRCRW